MLGMMLCGQNDLMLNNKGELAKTIQLAWKDVDMETLEVLNTCMFFHMRAVISADGGCSS